VIDSDKHSSLLLSKKIITAVKVFYSLDPNGICLVRGTLNIKGKGIEVPITFAIGHSAQVMCNDCNRLANCI
jgi:hypothetical protein